MRLFTHGAAIGLRRFLSAKWTRTLTAVAVGALTAGLLCTGFVAGFLSNQAPGTTIQFPAGFPGLNATATSRSEKFVMATGAVEAGIEGVFILDTLSGDLQCTAFNSRAGAFNSMFRRNILQDLKVGAEKRPEFLMVTGMVPLKGYQGVTCVAYVVECNTGNFAAYAVPWNRRAYASGAAQQAELVLLQVGSARTATLRE